MKRHAIVLALVAIALCTANDSLARKWASKSGQHTIDAELVEVQIVLKKADGKNTTVSVDDLSESDRQFVLRFLEPDREEFRNPFVSDKTNKGILSGKVVSITDGDTIGVLVDSKTVKVRLQGVDCPERGQPFGTVARKLASSLCFGKQAEVHVSGTDRYGRTLGDVVVDGKNVSHELLAAGLAWHYKQYSDDMRLAALETEAREAKRGLWADSDAIAPWEWRRLPARERNKQATDAGKPYQPSEVLGASPRGPPKKETSAGKYWLTTSSGVRHNSSCRWYHNTKNGRECGSDEGRACKVCGG